MVQKKTYPEWVEKYRTEGTTVKLVRGRYYLYRRTTSRRIEGKKNPQPVDEYMGVITEADGLIKGKKKRVRIDGIEVREYGFSKAMKDICPASWKQIHGERWEDILNAIIIFKSPNSFLLDETRIKDWNSFEGVQKGAAVSSLGRKLQDECGVQMDELLKLATVFLVKMGNKKVVSNIHEDHQAILKRLGMNWEVS